MKTIELTCKKCNGTMEVKEDEEKIICPFCGATNWIVESDSIKRDKAKYKYLTEKEVAKAESEVKRDTILYKFLRFKYIFIAVAVVAVIIFLRETAHITPPASASKLIGKQYDVVEKLFVDAGFLNVVTEAVPDLQNGFLYDAKQDDGKVISVSIRGQDKFVVNEGFIFQHTDKFDKNDPVRITYRTIPEPTRSPEDIAADESVNADWTEMPVILSAHETGKNQFSVTWKGKAPVYIILVDGAEKTVVADTKATFKLENGIHTIQIVPINRETKRDDIRNISGPITIKTAVNFSLDMYHMQKDHLVAGQFSKEIKIEYSAEKIYDSSPEDLKAAMGLHGEVHLTFTDPLGADNYHVTYKTGNEEYSIAFNKTDDASTKWVTIDDNSVQIIIDPAFLQTNNLSAIQFDKDYSFSVLLQKNPTEYAAKKEKADNILSSKKASVNLKTTPVWKDAPVITFSEQTSDGEVTIRWTHPAVELGCQYVLSLRNKAVFITTGESELIRVNGAEAVIRNLQNGNYTLVVTPENEGSKGTSSAEFTVVVNNNWSQAPEVILTQLDSRTAKVEITHVYGIESYIIRVSCGNTANILSYVNLDFSLYDEYTVDAKSPVTDFIFRYEKEAKPEDEIRVKFEIYGIHKSEDETLQHSATKTEQINLKQ